MNNRFPGRIRWGLVGMALAMSAAVGSALLTTGCVDQKKEIAIYQKQLDALPGSAEPAPDDSPLTLLQAMRLTERNDEALSASGSPGNGEAYLRSLYAKDKAFSTFLPQISVGPVLSTSNLSFPAGAKNVSVGSDINTSIFNVTNDATYQAAVAAAEQNRQFLLSEQQTVLLDVVTAYYTVLQFERSVIVDQNSLIEQDERVRQSVAQYRIGSGTPLAISQSESLASATRVQLIQDRTSVTTSRDMLSLLIGFPVGDRPLIDDYEPPRDILDPVEDWLADALAHRQDLIAAAVDVEVQRQGVRAAIGEYIPTITLDISHLIYNEQPPSPQVWTGALSANVPIFTGGQIEADVKTAFSLLRAAVLVQRQTRKTVEQNIRDAYANLVSSRDQIAELRVELKASRDSLVLAQREYAVGLATNLDILTATDTLLTTQLQLAREVYQEKINYLSLLRNAGRLTFIDAAATTNPSTEPSDLEITTPTLSESATQPVPVP